MAGTPIWMGMALWVAVSALVVALFEVAWRVRRLEKFADDTIEVDERQTRLDLANEAAIDDLTDRVRKLEQFRL